MWTWKVSRNINKPTSYIRGVKVFLWLDFFIYLRIMAVTPRNILVSKRDHDRCRDYIRHMTRQMPWQHTTRAHDRCRDNIRHVTTTDAVTRYDTWPRQMPWQHTTRDHDRCRDNIRHLTTTDAVTWILKSIQRHPCFIAD